MRLRIHPSPEVLILPAQMYHPAVLLARYATSLSFPFYKDISVDAAQLVFSGVAVHRALQLLSEETLAKMFMKNLGFSQYNGGNREPLFVPRGSGMYILVPWKPVVLVWGLLSAMIFFGFVASSVLQGKDPFAPSATITQPSAVKAAPAQAGQQPKRSQKAARTPSQ
jgi:hypothetical protein